MADFSQLKAAVANVIKTNGNEEITGAILQDVLLTIINSIAGGYMFGGVAQHSGNVGNPDYNVFYLAGSGSYTGYGDAITIEDGCYGVFRYNGSWTQEVVDIGVRLSGSVTAGETRGCTGDTINSALQQLFDNITTILDTMAFTYNTPSAQQATKAMLDVEVTVGGNAHVLGTLTLVAATALQAGLMSAEDKQKVDAFLTNLRSLAFADTTSQDNEGTQIAETMSATIGGDVETIATFTLLAATASKAGLMSAADKTYLDSLPAALVSIVNTASDNLAKVLAMIGYYVCDTAAGTAAKTVSASGYVLTNGGCIRIKMTNANTADNVTLNINSTGAKSLFYDGVHASSSNSWDAGEVLEVYYDGMQYQCVSGGGKFFTGEKVKNVSIVSAIGPNNSGIPTAGATYDEFPSNKEQETNGDLYITDENGNVIAVFEDGHIKTKYFDSSDIDIDQDFFISNYDNGDFGISDELGYVLLSLANGNISVKNFTNAPLKGKKVSFLGDSITTYANYPGSNNPFYTGSNAGVSSVNQTWWKSLCDKQWATVNRIYAYGGGDLINRLCLQYNNLYSGGTSGTAPDIVFILVGINDWYHNKTLGTIEDAENSNTTFYAAYKYLLKNLKETYPNAQIIGLTMLNSMIYSTTVPYLNTNNVSIRDFCKAVVECCDYYSVPCIDLNKIVNINDGNYTELLADYTHPNITGIGMMTKAIINNIHNVIYY